MDEAIVEMTLQTDIDLLQSTLHDIILYFWNSLIKTHTPSLQTNLTFQDILFRALDL